MQHRVARIHLPYVLAGIFSQSGSATFLGNGVGVIDVAGGGIIHCLAGTVTLALTYVASFGRSKALVAGEGTSQRDSVVMVSLGTLLIWLGFILLHVLPTVQWKQSHNRLVDEMVCFTLHTCIDRIGGRLAHV